MAKNLTLDNFLMILRSNISKLHLFLKNRSFKLKVIFSTNFRTKTRNIFRAVFEKNIKVSDFGLIQRPFREYLQIKNFFQKSGSVTFLPLQSPNFMQKIRKILRAISEKTALPTTQTTNKPNNQSTNTNLETFSRVSPNLEFFSTFIAPYLHAKNQENSQSCF